jgi:H+-transporting ATPase
MLVVYLNKPDVSTEDAKKASVDEMFSRLSASKEGLPSSEVEKRLQQYGPNEIPEKKLILLSSF